MPDNEIEQLFNCQELYGLFKKIVKENRTLTLEINHKGNNLDGFVVIVKYERLYPDTVK